MDRMFDTYAELLPELQTFVGHESPRPTGASELAHRQAVRARCLDARLRGLLPAGSLSNVGLFGSGQSYEQLLLRMRGHPLPEARRYADLILVELRKVIPSFLTRVDLPERRGVDRVPAGSPGGDGRQSSGAVAGRGARTRVSVSLTDFDPAGEGKVLTAMCYPFSTFLEQEIEKRVVALGPDDRRTLFEAYVGDRSNRRHRPGRAFELTGYRFDIVADYGAFRDLQRHRMLTVEWQPLGTHLGYEVPDLVEAAGLKARYVESLERSKSLHDLSSPRYFPEQSVYAVALAFHVRFVLQLSAREAMHVLELRSSPQGHPTYRRIVQEMHRLIADNAGHRGLRVPCPS